MHYSALPISDIPKQACEELKGIFFDIDDTFTHEGKIYPCAFESIWKARKTGLIVVPITGRPAGWADHIARMWPVDGVIGENGAFYFYYNEEMGRLIKRFEDPDPESRRAKMSRLRQIYQAVRTEFPGIELASDQSYRENDLAIDFSEDIPDKLSLEQAKRIKEICESHGAEAKISSIHVNTWFGSFDKLSMCKTFLQERFVIDLNTFPEGFLFIGDSPNDVPMFRFFPFSVGVATIEKYNHTALMEAFPKYIALGEGSFGFAETIDEILSKREGSRLRSF